MHAAVLLTAFPEARNIKSKNQRNHRVQNSAMRRHQNFFAFVFQRFQLEIEKIPHTRKHLRIRLASARNVFFRIFKRGADVVIDKPGFEKRRTFILSEAISRILSSTTGVPPVPAHTISAVCKARRYGLE